MSVINKYYGRTPGKIVSNTSIKFQMRLYTVMSSSDDAGTGRVFEQVFAAFRSSSDLFLAHRSTMQGISCSLHPVSDFLKTPSVQLAGSKWDFFLRQPVSSAPSHKLRVWKTEEL